MMSTLPRCMLAPVLGLALGCGGQSPVATDPAPIATTVQRVTGIGQTGETTPVPPSVHKDSSPEEVVTAFLNSMRDGNSAVASELLTDLARAETTRHQWPVQPPGAPSAMYQLGRPSFADPTQSVVHIPCLWTEADGGGGKIQFEVVWALRYQETGWRVAGFATEIVPGKPPFFFNFEDIANLKQTQALAEAALAEAAAAEAAVPSVAERPNTGPSVR